MRIATPLGKDFVLISTFTATEGLSQLFNIEVELLKEEAEPGITPTLIDPKSLIGKGVTITVETEEGTYRHFSGMVNRFSQGNRDVRFSYYNINVVPHVWMLTQNIQSRIFQQISVPEILKKVLKGFDLKFEMQGTFEPRNYCVQYRESDFDFISRLMEEEGIYYYFIHEEGKDLMVLANTPQSHRDCPTKKDIEFFVQVGDKEDFVGTINTFLSGYNLQTGKVTLWDFNFQLPDKKLDVSESSVHSFGDNQKLEVYDFPAGYARKYDGIGRDGADQAGELSKVFDDRRNTGKYWIDELDSRCTGASGRSDCPTITAGHRFNLKDHPNKDLNKTYTIITADHFAQQSPSYASDDILNEPYTNRFTCIEQGAGKPGFRPKRVTQKPIVMGGQTAMVVGPAGEEIFTDKYGRIKVQFHWDRDGTNDAGSSCWVRVAQSWAGNKWGAVFIPRIGMEVLVHFLEGDPDQPIVTGCVYNPMSMPPYTLPEHKTKSTVKSNSSKGGGGFNEFRFEDKKGEEQIFIHGQKDEDIRIRNDRRELIGNDRHLIVKRDKREKVERDTHIIIKRDEIQKIERDLNREVVGKVAFKTGGSLSHEISGSVGEKVGGSHTEEAGQTIYLKAGMNVVIEGGTQITLKVGGNFIDINPAGVVIQGTMVLINSGGAAGTAMPGTLVPPMTPEEAHIADNADPGSDAPTYKNQIRGIPPPLVPSYSAPWHNPEEPANKKKKSWIEIKLLDPNDNPVPGERYRITLPDGSTVAEGSLDANGFARVGGIDPGTCKVTFPNLDTSTWKPR